MKYRPLKILDAFIFRTQKISDILNFGKKFVLNQKHPKVLVINVSWVDKRRGEVGQN